MDPFPTIVDHASGGTSPDGHCWVFESVDGIPLRATLQSDGQLVVDDGEQSPSNAPVPPAARPAVRTLRTALDRDALRAAVDVDSLTLYGVGTCYDRIGYDFDRLPAFLGTDVRVDGDLISPERAYEGFERIGLTPAPALDRERRADTLAPDRFAFPDSAYADSPVAGVRIADKHGWRGVLDNDAVPDPDRPAFADAADAVASLVTDSLVSAATGDAVEWVREELARRHRGDLRAAGIDPSTGAFRSAVANEVGRRQ